jgi:hypothetical protein
MTPTTKKAQIEEVMKCGRDPIYFINTYCKIFHAERGVIPFNTFPFQDKCVQDFLKHRFNIVLKSRQLGLSTIAAAYALWLALFHKAKEILVIATKLPTAVNFIKKVKVMLKSLPSWLCISPFEVTRQEVRFKNGSRVQAIPTSEDAGRSEALSLLIIDEAAWIRNFEDIWTGLYPTLSTGGSAIVLSTPNGVGGQYYKLYTDAEAKANNFNPIKLMWYVHPEHDEAWFKSESKQMSRRKVAQEMLCEFIGSGDTYVTAEDIAFLESIKKDPLFKGLGLMTGPEWTAVERDVWVWEQPEAGTKYILSADVARGDAADFSTFHIFNSKTGNVVAEFRGKVAPDRFAELIDKYGRKYNTAYVCPENNTFGWTTCAKLREARYPRLIFQNTKLSQPDSFIPSSDDKPGFSTQGNSKDLALSKFEEGIRNRTIKFFSARMINELRTFIWNGQKATAMKDSHDDLVMAAAIGSWLFDGMFGGKVGAVSNEMALFLGMGKTSTNYGTVPGNGHDVRPVFRPAMMPHVVHRPQNPNPHIADVNDFSWVMK